MHRGLVYLSQIAKSHRDERNARWSPVFNEEIPTAPLRIEVDVGYRRFSLPGSMQLSFTPK